MTLGTTNVYFQPPASIRMTYPAIVYKRDGDNTVYADNANYRNKKRYMVTVIDRNPDSDIPDKIKKLPYCRFSRHYSADDLNHDVYNLYF